MKPYKILVGTFVIDGYSVRKIWYDNNTKQYTVTDKNGVSINNESPTMDAFNEIDDIISAYFVEGYDIDIVSTKSNMKQPTMEIGFG